MDFPGNSNRVAGPEAPLASPEDKKLEKVVTGEVRKRKVGIGKRFKEVFFGGDFRNAARFVAGEVMLPAFRNLIVDASTKGVERVIYGDGPPRRGYRTDEYRPRVNYSGVSRRDPRERAYLPDQPPHQRPGRADVGELVLSSREEADLVVERMIDVVDQYGVVSVADLNELVGFSSSHVDQKWGWTNLNKITVRQTRDGYAIDLPTAEAL